MDNHKARKIGGKQAIIAVTIGIVTAQTMITGLIWKGTFTDAFLWFAHTKLVFTFLLTITSFYSCGYFFGGQAGSEILVKKQHHIWVGIKTGLLTLWSGTLLASLIAFFQQGISNFGGSNALIIDYAIRPMLIATLFGTVPVVIVGYWFGKQIKKQEQLE